jgi:hypothetical protein
MRIFYTICLVLVVLLGGPSFLSAFDFDDLEKLEKAEQEDLLAKASQAARNWNFSEATSFLNQARNKGYAPTEIKAVEQLIASNQSAKAEKERREEEARQAAIAAAKAEEDRREANRQRVAAREASSSSSQNQDCRIDGKYIMQNGKDIGQYDGKYIVNISGKDVGRYDGKYIVRMSDSKDACRQDGKYVIDMSTGKDVGTGDAAAVCLCAGLLY